MNTTPTRRVVTSTDDRNKSVVADDGPPPLVMGGGSGPGITILWEADTPVTYEAMGGDPAETFTPLPQPGAARFLRLVLPGRSSSADAEALDVPKHRTDTLDLLYVASGEVDLVLDESSVHLSAGDHLVMQGDVHGWRNTSPQECVLVAVMLGAPAR